VCFACSSEVSNTETDSETNTGTDSETNTGTDSDEDVCPNDPNKTEPGFCGCGFPEDSCIDDTDVQVPSSKPFPLLKDAMGYC